MKATSRPQEPRVAGPLHSLAEARSDPTYILMEGADESGRQDVPLLTAEFHRRLNAIIHYQREELMHRVRAKVRKLTKEKKELIYKTLKLGKNPPHPYPSIPTNENKLSLFSPSKYLLGVHLLFFFFSFRCSTNQILFKII